MNEQELDKALSEGLRETLENIGSLDCVVSHGWFHRAWIFFFGRWMNKTRMEVCNPTSFRPGQRVQFFSPMSDTPRGSAIVSAIHRQEDYERPYPVVEFTEPIPKGTKRGDFIVGED